MSDSFATRDILRVNGIDYTIFSLARLGQRHDLSRLPFSMKILLENLLRCEDGGMTVGKEHIEAVAQWNAAKEPDTEIAFMPARVFGSAGIEWVGGRYEAWDAWDQALGGNPAIVARNVGSVSIFPVDGLEMKRTGSRYSRVGPAVMSTRRPAYQARRSITASTSS